MTDLDLDKGHVFVRQDWRYQWIADRSQAPWTHEERFQFHHAVDRAIWAHWSLQARLKVSTPATGSVTPHAVSDHLVTRFGEQGLTLSFDVRSVVGPAHWQAHVHKTDPAFRPFPRAMTDFARRTLELHDFETEARHASRFPNDPRKQAGFSVLAHEFGHAIGNANPRGLPDEYEQGNRFRNDVHSIMNIGRHLRARHLSLICETLGKLVRQCQFRAVASRQ